MSNQLGTRDVLVAVDMQNVFVDGAGEWGVTGYPAADATIDKLRAGFPGTVVLTRFVPDSDEPGSWRSYYDRWPMMRLPRSNVAWDLTLDVNPDDVVISVPTFSKWGPQLEEIVALDATLVLCGVATDCCVIATALAAVDSGRKVLLVHDACAGVSPEIHDKAVSLMGLLSPMINLTTTADLLAGGSA